MVRWINTKEEQANKIIKIIAEYWDYVDALKAHRDILQFAMKSKLSLDVAVSHDLEHTVEEFTKMHLRA